MINRITLLLFLFIIACAPVATNKRNLIVEGIKANGQQPEVIDQQPALTNQPNMSEDMINKTNQLLQETRAKSIVAGQQQTEPQKQQPTMYENFMSMNPAQLRDFQANLHILKQKNEILSNVGSERMKFYEKEVSAGRMKWSQALELSKKDISSLSRELDNIYYARDKDGNFTATTQDMLKWYDKNKLKPEFGEDESKRFDTRYSEVKARENASIKNLEQSKSKQTSEADKVALELKKYKKMLDDGLISQEDYDAKKNKLLGL